MALERYSHNLVIGNLLSTRKWEVVFVATGRPDQWIRIPSVAKSSTVTVAGRKRSLSMTDAPADNEGHDQPVPEDRPLDPSLLPEGDPDVEIESLIIPALEKVHTIHVQEAKVKSSANGPKA